MRALVPWCPATVWVGTPASSIRVMLTWCKLWKVTSGPSPTLSAAAADGRLCHPSAHGAPAAVRDGRSCVRLPAASPLGSRSAGEREMHLPPAHLARRPQRR
jgi:hypothetical protein